MDNENTTAQETGEQTSDSFLSGFGEEETEQTSSEPETEDNGAENSEEEPETIPSAEGEGTEEPENSERADTDAEDTSAGDAEQSAQPVTIHVSHMGEEKDLTADEARELAQKGMDYDRVRQKYDEAKPVVEMVRQFADQQHMTVEQYISFVRTEAKKAAGMDDEEARRAVELEDREATVSQREAEQQEAAAAMENAATEQKSANDRMQEDLALFQTRYPDAAKEPDKIPQEVWDAVKGGTSLCDAYGNYVLKSKDTEIAALRQKLTAKEQNQKNQQRSSGSMRTSGNENQIKDPFLDGFGG